MSYLQDKYEFICVGASTVMRRTPMFRPTTDRIYDGGSIRLQYYNIIILKYNIIIPLCYNCLQYLVQ